MQNHIDEEEDSLKKSEVKAKPKRFWQTKWTLFMFVLMCTEWGDPSQISAMGLAAKYGMLSIIVGGGLAQITSIIIAISLGSCVTSFCSERWLNLVSGLLFLGFAVREILAVVNGE